jgi:pyruvate dehydrogenase E2 component (dihydrolipoamide acetyltransferase)
MPIITMPKLSDTMVEGTIARWKKKEGDTVEMGDILAEVETDKATMEMEAFDEGILKEIYVGDGGVAEVGRGGAVLGEGETVEGARRPAAKPDLTTAKPQEARRRRPDNGSRGGRGTRQHRRWEDRRGARYAPEGIKVRRRPIVV